ARASCSFDRRGSRASTRGSSRGPSPSASSASFASWVRTRPTSTSPETRRRKGGTWALRIGYRPAASYPADEGAGGLAPHLTRIIRTLTLPLRFRAAAGLSDATRAILTESDMAGDGANLVHLNDLNWKEEVLDSKVPVLVDFSAVWCGPCKVLSPIIQKLSDELVGKVKVGKLDIDESPA